MKISLPLPKMANSKTISQEQFDTLITKYFIRSMIPLHHIEKPHFRNMFSVFNIKEVGLSIMNKTCLEHHIEDMYTEVRAEIKNKLKNIKHVCINSEHIWSYLIISCHWIDSDLKRQSVTLSCRPCNASDIEVRHCTKECVRNYLENITGANDYNIYFGENQESDKYGLYLKNGVLLMTDIEGLDYKRQIQYSLKEPIETDKAIRITSNWYRLCETAENKKTAHIVRNIIGHTLNKPKDSNTYDIIKQLLAIGQEKYNELTTALDIKYTLQEKDFIFAAEYLKVYKPLKDAFDILEDNQNTYYGNLLPCLLSIRKKLMRFSNENDKYVHCQPSKLLEKIELEYRELFNLSTERTMNAAIAAISYPKFKDRWLSCIDSYLHDTIRDAFELAVNEEIGHLEKQSEKEHKTTDDFFNFHKETNVQTVITRYLADKDMNLSMLHRHKEIKNVFMKYNTPLSVKRYKYIKYLFDIVNKTINKPYSKELSQKIIFLKCNEIIL